MTSTIRRTIRFSVLAAITMLALPALSHAAEPTKWVLSSTIGANVNLTKLQAGAPQEERNQCTVASGDTCQFAEEGNGPREFRYSTAVAVSTLTGDVYVADRSHSRIQVLNAAGGFLFMFGWNVNKTKVAEGTNATQREKNYCSATSGDECGAGEKATGLAEQMLEPEAITVDPVSGDVYVTESGSSDEARVEAYTPEGEFVLMIGGGVNSNGTNLCTKAEAGKCQKGTSGTGHSEFNRINKGNTLTISDGELYVADSGRVQRFDAATGRWLGQITLTGLAEGAIRGVAVDPSGDLFVTDGHSPIREYNANGEPQACAIDTGGEQFEIIAGMAFDAYGRLGVVGYKFTSENPPKEFDLHGQLYDVQGAECGKTVGGEIVPPSGEMNYGSYQGSMVHPGSLSGLGFSSHEDGEGHAEDQLYVAISGELFDEIEAYKPVLFPEVKTCATSGVMFTTAVLCGEIDPNGLATTGFFKYGTSENALNVQLATSFSSVAEAFEPVAVQLSGLTPNETYYDQAYAQAEIEGKPQSTGGQPVVSFHTQTPASEVAGVPSVSHVGDEAAVLSAAVNPEHAPARYYFRFSSPSGGELTVRERDLNV